MTEETRLIIDAIVEREYFRAQYAISLLNTEKSSFGDGVYDCVNGIKERFFKGEKGLKHILANLLEDKVNPPLFAQVSSKSDRYLSFLKYLTGPKNFLESGVGGVILATLPFLRKGVEIDVKDQDGNPVKVSIDSLKDHALEISENANDFLEYAASYVRAIRDAHFCSKSKGIDKYFEASDIHTFVNDEKVELYALLRTFAGGKPIEPEELLRKYENFAGKYLTGREFSRGEYSCFLNKPIDFLLTTSKFLMHIVGDPDRWCGIIRFFSQPKSQVYDVIADCGKAQEVHDEFRRDAYDLMGGFHKFEEEFLFLAKELVNFSSKNLFDRQVNIIRTSTKEMQKEVLKRYSA